jgi:GTP-binding protein
MFVDEARIQVAGGKGGDGANVMHREKYIPFGGPAGGRGGRGGSVYLVATRNHKTLSSFRGRVHFKAEDGVKGGKQDRTGRGGEDRMVEVPLGTLVKADDGKVLADLAAEGDRFLAARGGRGGRGNKSLAHEGDPLPRWAEKGALGQERWVRLELKVMADVGLVGLPNAGKSTLLSTISNARPKVAAYPFTTLEPHLGMVNPPQKWQEGGGFVVADIPGLIEGAHEGTGLGDRFLRHVERTRLLLHLVDVSGFEGRDPVESYRSIRKELEAHHVDLAERPELVVATKTDVPESAEHLEKLREALDVEVVSISSATRDGVDALLDRIRRELETLPEKAPLRFEPEVEVFTLETEDDGTEGIEIVREDVDFWILTGRTMDRLLATHDLDDVEALHHLDGRLRALGAYRRLAELGAKEGHTVRVGDHLFDYFPEE